MAPLIYSAIASLDGYVADSDGRFDWAAPDEEVHRFVNELERPVGTYLYGRRMYEVMAYWETAHSDGGSGPGPEFAGIWRGADKVVYSRTLDAVATTRTRIERGFDPGAVARMKADADRPITVGGPTLAGLAVAAGLVDELHLLAVPVIVGGGLPWLSDGLRAALELLDIRRFTGGAVHLHYRVRT